MRHILLLFVSLLLACGNKSSNKAPPVTVEQAKAQEVFHSRCAPCHGANGMGDGPASATLDPKPRNYTDNTWQGSVTDDYIQKIIKGGGAAVGKSPAMPNNPDLDDGTIMALKDVVRSFKKN